LDHDLDNISDIDLEKLLEEESNVTPVFNLQDGDVEDIDIFDINVFNDFIDKMDMNF
jgi:hypothetical protein